MKKLIIGLMASTSMLLTACGEFQTINKGSNEVLEALSPYLSEDDQKRASELSAVYNKDINIRENLVDSEMIEIEIEGNVAQLQIVNKDGIAFRLNGKNIYIDELNNNELLESIISSSLVKVSSNSTLLSLMSAKKSEAFLGSMLSGVFGLVIKGVFNFAVAKITEKAGVEVGAVVGGLVGVPAPNKSSDEIKNDVKDQVKGAKDSILSSLLGTVLGSIGVPAVNTNINTNTNTNVNTNPVVTQPSQNCNLFCNLLGLLVNNLIK